MARKITYMQAISEALRQEMQRDPSVVIFGEDVMGGSGRDGHEDAWGGPFGLTKGFHAEFPGRILDTPISIHSPANAVRLMPKSRPLTPSGRSAARDAESPENGRISGLPIPHGVRDLPCGRLEFEQVWFEYTPGNPVLRDVSFVIEPGPFV